jgi:hypothetical protein
MMKSKAKAILTRKTTGMVAAETSPGFVTILELLGCEQVRSGDTLVGNLNELDNQVVFNETQNETMRVFIHERGCAVHKAIEKYFVQAMPSEPSRRPMWPGREPGVSRERFANP